MRLSAILLALAGLFPPGPLCAGPKGDAPVPAAVSMEVLVLRAVEALNARDTSALLGMTADRADFMEVYSHFTPDTASDRREFAVGYFLSDNRKLMRRAIDYSGGHQLALARFTVAGPVQSYGKSALHRGLTIWVARDSAEMELNLIKSVVLTETGWKIWSYTDD